MAAEAVRLSGIELKGDLVVACVVGETQGGVGTHHLMQSGFRTDMAVVAEPFGVGNVVTVHAGIVHMAIHTFGVTGHLRDTEGPVNAIFKMMKVIEALDSVEFTYEPRADLPLLPKLNVGSIIGGIGSDYVLVEPPYVPDICTILVDVHFLPGQTVDSIVGDIRRALDPLADADSELKYEIEIPPPKFFRGSRRLVMDPLDVPTDEYIVQAVARSHETVTGKPPKVIGTVLPNSYSADDTCHLWNAGIPCLIYGPSSVYGTEDEDDAYAIISEMVDCTKVLAVTALEICNLVKD
jgi:acetylornithine deacetylase